jgi:type II secretory pathway pseudopilin PulG
MFVSSRRFRPRHRVNGARNQKGFTLIEAGMAIVIALLVIAAAVAAFSAQRLKAQVRSATSDVGSIYQAAQDWASTRANFTGVNCANLAANNQLPKNVGNCTGTDPWGGNYTVNPNAANSGQVDINVTAVPAGAGQQLVDKFSNSSANAVYNAGAQTFTATF